MKNPFSKVSSFIKQNVTHPLGDGFADLKNKLPGKKTLSRGGKNTLLAAALFGTLGVGKVANEAYQGYRDTDTLAAQTMIGDNADILSDSTQLSSKSYINSLSPEDQAELKDLTKKLNLNIDVSTLTNAQILELLEKKVKPMIQDEQSESKKSMWLSLGVLLFILGLLMTPAFRIPLDRDKKLKISGIHDSYEDHMKLIMSAEFRDHIRQNLKTQSKVEALFAAIAVDGSVTTKGIVEEATAQKQVVETKQAKIKSLQSSINDIAAVNDTKQFTDTIGFFLNMVNGESDFKHLIQGIKTSLQHIETKQTRVNEIGDNKSGLIANAEMRAKTPLIQEKTKLNTEIKKEKEKIGLLIDKSGVSISEFFTTKLEQLDNEIVTIKSNLDIQLGQTKAAEKQLQERDTDKERIVQELFPDEDGRKHEKEITDLESQIAKLEKEIEEAKVNNTEKISKKEAYKSLLDAIKKAHGISNEEAENLGDTIEILTNQVKTTQDTSFTINQENGSTVSVKLSECIIKNSKGEYDFNDNGNALSTESDSQSTTDMEEAISLIEKLQLSEKKLIDLNKLSKAQTESDGALIKTLEREIELKKLNSSRDKAYLNLGLTEDINANLNTVRQAFSDTVDQLKGEGSYTVEQVYNTFITNIQIIDPNWSLPSKPEEGIQGIQEELIKRDDDILLEYGIKVAEVGAGGAGGYHAFRGLLNQYPDVFANSDASMAGAAGMAILGGLAVYFTTDAIRQAFKNQYKDSLSKNQGNWLMREISVSKALLNNPITKKRGMGAVLVYRLAGMTGYADVMGSGATRAADARKQEIFVALDTESNKINANTGNFVATIDSLFDDTQDKALKTVQEEITNGGAGPFTGKKVAHIYGLPNNWPVGLDKLILKKKIPGFEEGFASIDSTQTGQLVQIQKEYQDSMQIIKDLMFIEVNGEKIPFDQVPRAIKNMETGLTQVNISSNINAIKEAYEEKMTQTINDYISLTKNTNDKLANLEKELKKVGGAEIVFEKVDTQLLDSLVKLTLSEPVKKFLEAMGQANPFFDNMGEMRETITNLPTGRREKTIMWLLLISILPIWILIIEKRKWAKNQKKKGESENQLTILAQEAFELIQGEVSKMTDDTIKGQLQQLIDGKTYHAVSTLVNIPESANKKFGKSRVEMGRIGKPKWDNQQMLHAKGINTARAEVIQLIKDNKQALDNELGSMLDHSELSDSVANPQVTELYTDRFVRMNHHTEETLCTAIADMISKSETFRNLIINKYGTLEDNEKLGIVGN